jgi:hypothetical protein
VEKEGEYGLQVTDLTPEIAKDLNVNRETAVVVVGVRRFKGSEVLGSKGSILQPGTRNGEPLTFRSEEKTR